MKALLIFLALTLNSIFSLAQAQSQPVALSSEDNAKLIQRREMARDFLRVIGVEGYVPLDAEHARELTEELRAWALRGTQMKSGAAELKAIPAGLYPNQWERWGRFHQIKIEGTEQPKTQVVQVAGVSTPILNPDRALWKFSLTVKPSEFFPTPADVSGQLQAFKSAGGTQVTKKEGKDNPGQYALCKPVGEGDIHDADDLIGCLSKTRRKDVFFRGVSGLSGILSGGKNPQVQQGILVNPTSAAAQRNFQLSGQVDWDPTSMFPTGSDWKSAQDSAALYEKGSARFNEVVLRKKCTGDPAVDAKAVQSCLPKIIGPSRGTFLLAALIPQVEYKVQTQFDFIKSGGGFIAAPFPEGHLWYVSFTTDLRKAIMPLKARTDALAVLRPKQDADKDKTSLILAYCEMSLSPAVLVDDKWYEKFEQTVATVLASK